MEISQGVPGKMRIALTFDCGAGRGYIDQILQTLNEYQVPATFFVTGSWAENNPDDVRRISQSGFRIGNHTQNHLNLTEISDDQIVKELASVEETILELTGKSTKPLFRPPFGSRDERVLQVVASQGYWSIYWTVDSLDWQEGHDPQWVKERILSRLDDGAIVLCHVASEYTYLVLGELIQEIRGRGFTFVPLDDFLELPP
jgi:peptidoglycan/xylan/chitin deacetylase (PgdA/CDA1 family)